VDVPQVDSNRDYWAQIASENIDQLDLPYGRSEASNPILEKIARRTPYYERNRVHVCSFWLKGDCSRGALCSFRHEHPITPQEGNITEAIRDRFHGINDPVAKKILNQIENSKYLKAPDDKTIKSISVSFVDERDLAELEMVFKKYGTIDDITLVKQHAFITFNKRACAEDAIKNSFTSFVCKGKKMNVVWCKKADEQADVSSKPHLRVGDGSLLPAYDFNLKPVNIPRAPNQPPAGSTSKKEQDKHL